MSLSALAALCALALPAPASQDGTPPEPAPAPAPAEQESPLPDDGLPPVTTASGLVYSVLEPGLEGGPTPALGDLVEVHYTGYLTDGTVFDDSRAPREPGGAVATSKFRLGRVIAGWNEGLQLMPAGSRYKLTVPPKLAYGDRERGAIPANSTLIFDVELIGFEPGDPGPAFRPLDDDAPLLARGIRYQIVEPGEGDPPAPDEPVKLWFAMYSPEGVTIDCSEWDSGPIRCTTDSAQPPFIAELLPVLRPGAVALVEVPPSVGLGDAVPPGMEAGDPTIWRIELLHVARKPELPAFRAVPAEGAQTTQSGIRYVVLEPGAGEPPTRERTFKLEFTYWTAEGELLDSSLNTPQGCVTASVEQLLLPFMQELPLAMAPGSVWVAEVPADQAFGERVPPGVEPGAPTVWRLALTDVLSPLPVPPFAQPDAEQAEVTDSGLTIQVLRPGSGAPPRRDQRVRVHYAGWIADSGELFDSSYERGEPATFGVTGVIPGWTEALLELPPGSVALLGIPSDLAYGAQGAPPRIGPNEDLVFRVEVVAVLE